MENKIKKLQSLDLDDFSLFFEAIHQSFDISIIFQNFGKNLAAKYWTDIQVNDHIPTIALFKSILYNLSLSDWFEIVSIEQKENEIEIIINLDSNTNSKKIRCNFLHGFIEELANKSYSSHGPIKTDRSKDGKLIIYFQEKVKVI